MWVSSSVGGAEKCYGVLGADKLVSACNFDCGYTGCEHISSDYCDTSAVLVTIGSSAENEVFASLLPLVEQTADEQDRGFWIGVKNYGDGWVFLGTKFVFTNWAPGEPDDTAGACAVMKNDTMWHAVPCGSHMARCTCAIQITPYPSPPPMPTPSAPPTPPTPCDTTKSPPPPISSAGSGAVLGGVIGGAGAVLVVLAVFFLLARKRRRSVRRPPNVFAGSEQVDAHAGRKDTGTPAAQETQMHIPVVSPNGECALATTTTSSTAQK